MDTLIARDFVVSGSSLETEITSSYVSRSLTKHNTEELGRIGIG